MDNPLREKYVHYLVNFCRIILYLQVLEVGLNIITVSNIMSLFITFVSYFPKPNEMHLHSMDKTIIPILEK